MTSTNASTASNASTTNKKVKAPNILDETKLQGLTKNDLTSALSRTYNAYVNLRQDKVTVMYEIRSIDYALYVFALSCDMRQKESRKAEPVALDAAMQLLVDAGAVTEFAAWRAHSAAMFASKGIEHEPVDSFEELDAIINPPATGTAHDMLNQTVAVYKRASEQWRVIETDGGLYYPHEDGTLHHVDDLIY